ncbi:hypothetical protein [Streptomyces sp. NPDC051554]|uniref:hypothetical protein n=1 Tax=Streptomyces sp. NPDC051554 TaxID=3365656 RepID=UPI0037B9019E
MTAPLPYPYIVVRCDLAIDGVDAHAVRQVSRDVWFEHPAGRALVEKELRFTAAQHIVEKLTPPVYEVNPDTLRAEESTISRAEALRLAEAHGKALLTIADRLRAAGENYAVTDAYRAVETVHALVEKLAGDEGRLPVRPGNMTTT